MSVLDSVLTAIRGKRQEQARTAWQQYTELIDQLAKGEQVDVDELATVLDSLDRSDKDLKADVANKQKRFELATLLEESRTVSATIPTLTQKHEAAKAALEKALVRLQPAIDEAWGELKSAGLRENQLMHAEPELLRSVMDPAILEQQKSIDLRRSELAAEIAAIQDEVAKARETIRNARGNLEVATANSKLVDPYATNSDEFRRRTSPGKAQQWLEQLTREHEPLLAKFADLQKQQALITAEQRALNQLKLVP